MLHIKFNSKFVTKKKKIPVKPELGNAKKKRIVFNNAVNLLNSRKTMFKAFKSRLFPLENPKN